MLRNLRNDDFRLDFDVDYMVLVMKLLLMKTMMAVVLMQWMVEYAWSIVRGVLVEDHFDGRVVVENVACRLSMQRMHEVAWLMVVMMEMDMSQWRQPPAVKSMVQP